jgi:hypothetical protein
MAGVTQSDVTDIIETVHIKSHSAVSTIFHDDVLFDLPEAALDTEQSFAGERKLNGLFSYDMTKGGHQLDWPVEYSSGAAQEMSSETENWPEPTSNSHVNATLSPRYFDTTLKIYRWTLDGAKGDAQVIDILADKMEDRMRALQTIINSTMLGTGTSNLQAAVDSSTTYAGVSSRSTYGFDSAETAVGGALALSDLEDLIESIVLKGARLQDLVWVMRPNQLTNVMNLAGYSGNAVVAKNTNTGGAFDPSFVRSQVTVGGIPVVEATNLTSTVILLLHVPSLQWWVHKPLEVIPQAVNDYSFTWAFVIGLIMRITKPHLCGKLTGVTA